MKKLDCQSFPNWNLGCLRNKGMLPAALRINKLSVTDIVDYYNAERHCT